MITKNSKGFITNYGQYGDQKTTLKQNHTRRNDVLLSNLLETDSLLVRSWFSMFFFFCKCLTLMKQNR